MMGEKVTTIPGFNPFGNEIVVEIKKCTEEFIEYMQANVPDGRHKAIALTNYEQATMWAIKGYFT